MVLHFLASEEWRPRNESPLLQLKVAMVLPLRGPGLMYKRKKADAGHPACILVAVEPGT
jgi:hypothetical protein